MTASARLSGPAFLRLDTRAGWRMSALSSGLLVDERLRVLRLGTPGDFRIPPGEPFGSFGGMTLPTGLAVSPRGDVFLADPDGNRILYYIPPFGREQRPDGAEDHWPFRPLWPATEEIAAAHPAPLPFADATSGAAPHRLDRPSDVASTATGDLVVADTGNARLVVYTFPGMRVRHVWRIPGGRPRAVEFDSRGFAYVADPGNGRIWRLDPLWRVDQDWRGGEGQLTDPAHVAVTRDDRVLVLDAAAGRVFRLNEKGRVPVDGDGELLALAPTELFDQALPPPLRMVGDRLELPRADRPRCPALRLDGVSVDGLGRLGEDGPALLARPRRINLPRSGVFVSEALDSEIPACQWHRVVLAGDIPVNGRVLIQTFSHETLLETSRVRELDDGDWSTPLVVTTGDVPEALVQSPPGRYLWLRIELFGDGQKTPALGHVEIQAPRRGALRWLPPPFHQDRESAAFLDRYLSYFDTMYAEVERQIHEFGGYLDPFAVPAGEFLDWLGSWFDWEFLAEWPESVRREMIAEAVSFFRERGTINGLRRLLQWHTGLTGDQPQFIEHFRLRDYATRREVSATDLEDGSLYIGERPLAPPSDGLAHRFTVVVPESAVPDADSAAALSRLIEAQKPAHTSVQIRVIHPGIRIGRQSSIGIDTWLSDYPAEPLGDLTLGQSGQLAGDSSGGLRIGDHLPFRGAEGQCA